MPLRLVINASRGLDDRSASSTFSCSETISSFYPTRWLHTVGSTASRWRHATTIRHGSPLGLDTTPNTAPCWDCSKPNKLGCATDRRLLDHRDRPIRPAASASEAPRRQEHRRDLIARSSRASTPGSSLYLLSLSRDCGSAGVGGGEGSAERFLLSRFPRPGVGRTRSTHAKAAYDRPSWLGASTWGTGW